MYYRKALKNSPERVLKKSECDSKSELWTFIPSFFENDEPGLHLLAVCLPSSEVLPDSRKFREAFSLENNPCIKLDDVAPDHCTNRYFVITQRLPDYSTILSTVSQYVEQCYETKELFSTALKYYKCHLTSLPFAEGLQKELEDVIQERTEKHCCHTLFVIVALPEECFLQFESKDAFYPPFIEYVVLGEKEEKIIEEKDRVTQLLKQKLAEADEKINELQKNAERSKEAYTQELFNEKASYEAEKRMLEQIIICMYKGEQLTEEMLKIVDSIIMESLPTLVDSTTRDKQYTKKYLNG